MPGADLAGMAGLHDQVDNHYFRLFSSALTFSVFGAAGQLSQPQNNNNQLSSQQ
ncbi:MAG: TrbI/VirB10 family protein, partial [Pseudomonadota bacterium]